MNVSLASVAIMVLVKQISWMLFTISVLPKAILPEMFKYSKTGKQVLE
jgi:hypothetical protein